MLLRWRNQFAFNFIKSVPIFQNLKWNHYKALGLTPSATAAEVKDAFYKLSKLYHPDRNNGSESCVKKFRDIVAAYEVLGKAHLRKKYDSEIINKIDIRNPEYIRKKNYKRNKKNSTIPKMKTYQYHPHPSEFYRKNKNKEHSSNNKKSRGKNQKEEVDTFIVKAIPLVVACLMSCKKR